jgi:hypothetical protein
MQDDLRQIDLGTQSCMYEVFFEFYSKVSRWTWTEYLYNVIYRVDLVRNHWEKIKLFEGLPRIWFKEGAKTAKLRILLPAMLQSEIEERKKVKFLTHLYSRSKGGDSDSWVPSS